MGVGAAGVALTSTFTVAGELEQPFALAVTLYIPLIPVVDEGIEGFCNEDE